MTLAWGGSLILTMILLHRVGSHQGLKAIVEQTHEALLGLQPATCSPSGATAAAAAGTVLENVRHAAARLSPTAGDAAAQQEGDAAGSTLTKAEQGQNSSASAAGPQEPHDRSILVSPSAPSQAVSPSESSVVGSLAELSSTEAAALLDLDLALLRRIVQSERAASLAADIRCALLAVVKPSGEACQPAKTCLITACDDMPGHTFALF